jgi:hypothetical protein
LDVHSDAQGLLVAVIDGVNDLREELELARAGEGVVLLLVMLEGAACLDDVLDEEQNA